MMAMMREGVGGRDGYCFILFKKKFREILSNIGCTTKVVWVCINKRICKVVPHLTYKHS